MYFENLTGRNPILEIMISRYTFTKCPFSYRLFIENEDAVFLAEPL